MSDRINRHEHLYEKIQENVVESKMFPDDVVSADRLLLGCKVILCTLSMLSNSKLGVFTRLVPVELVVVDEASQIEIGDYLPMLSLFQATLRKLVFIGDDKQCSYLYFIC
jgi:regulator of nonsense transcripts 1